MLFFLIAVISYSISLVLLSKWAKTNRVAGKRESSSPVKLLSIALVSFGIAWSFHGMSLYINCCGGGAFDLALGYMISLLGWMTGFLLLVGCFFQPTKSLAIIVVPISLVCLFTGQFFPGEPLLLDTIPEKLRLHILVAVPTFGVMCIAFAQAVVLLIQESQVQHPTPNSMFSALPSLQTMDSNLFSLISLGFVLLSISLILGAYANYSQSGQLLAFNHHVLLVTIAWVGFGIVLLGRWRVGWRGRPAAIGSIAAFLVLILAYYGSRFVSEVLISG